MRATRIPVAVEFERVPVASRWADSRWQPSRVVPVDGDPDTADESAVERLDAEGVLERWRFPGHTTEMHVVESEGYYLNLSAPDPMAFVMWRHRDDGEPPVHPVVVTLSYNEAARMMDGGEQVDPVPLDPRLRAMLEPFVAANYKPEPKRKHKRKTRERYFAAGPQPATSRALSNCTWVGNPKLFQHSPRKSKMTSILRER